MITFDHIAVTALDLQSGITHVHSQTGLTLPAGGEHPQMATHNAVARFTDDTYFEIIAPNPAATPPTCPRWFDLDRVTKPALTAWILRTDDIEGCLIRAKALGFDLGRATPLERGSLKWRFSLTDDGKTPMQGAAPLIIQWDSPGPHPASTMVDLGLRLQNIQITTPQADALTTLLAYLGLETPPEIIQGEVTKIIATLGLPNGAEAILS